MAEDRTARLPGLPRGVEGILQGMSSEELEAVQRYVRSQHAPPLGKADSRSGWEEWRFAAAATGRAPGIVDCALAMNRALSE